MNLFNFDILLPNYFNKKSSNKLSQKQFRRQKQTMFVEEKFRKKSWQFETASYKLCGSTLVANEFCKFITLFTTNNLWNQRNYKSTNVRAGVSTNSETDCGRTCGIISHLLYFEKKNHIHNKNYILNPTEHKISVLNYPLTIELLYYKQLP